jgi:GTPase SAR1 family protein
MMNSETSDPSPDDGGAAERSPLARLFPTPDIFYPGLSSEAEEINTLVRDFPKSLAVFTYKQSLPGLWVVFAGGTGTGKSTLFNAFCGQSLSATGVERPKTVGPVIYAHRDCPIEEGFPFESIQIEHRPAVESETQGSSGAPGQIILLEHDIESLSHLVIVDTPDIDSVETENRQMAEDLYLVSDAVVFVTSQEKYADEVPVQFLVRIAGDEKPYFLLLNKMQEPLTPEDIVNALNGQGVRSDPDRVWLISYEGAPLSQRIPADPGFQAFRRRFDQEFPPEVVETVHAQQNAGRAESLNARLTRLIDLLERENGAALEWVAKLDVLCKAACHDLINEEKRRFTEKSRKHIQVEIRNLFAKYDVLAGPRRFVREILVAPLRILGLAKEASKGKHKNALAKVRRRIDFAPVLKAVERFNRLVLQTLSPAAETSPLFRALRQPGVVLTDEEVRSHMVREQDQVDTWLEKTFEALSRDLPKQKKWGIYSTSILWGILILSFEIAVGGGFTVLDAVLDSALAPFVTKGAVELFAYNEIQKTARELANRYQQGLLSVVDYQRKQYQGCIQSLTTGDGALKALEDVRGHIRDYT